MFLTRYFSVPRSKVCPSILSLQDRSDFGSQVVSKPRAIKRKVLAPAGHAGVQQPWRLYSGRKGMFWSVCVWGGEDIRSLRWRGCGDTLLIPTDPEAAVTGARPHWVPPAALVSKLLLIRIPSTCNISRRMLPYQDSQNSLSKEGHKAGIRQSRDPPRL